MGDNERFMVGLTGAALLLGGLKRGNWAGLAAGGSCCMGATEKIPLRMR